MTEVDRAQLDRTARSTVAPYRAVVQARALLALADGASVRSTARALGTTPNTVARWRDRYVTAGLSALGVVAPGRGRKPVIPKSTIEAIVADTLHSVPDDGFRGWSTRTLAARHGVSKDTVARIWRARGIAPLRVIKKSATDPGRAPRPAATDD